MKQEKYGNQEKSQKYQPGNRRPELDDEDSLPGQRQRPIEAEGREGNYDEEIQDRDQGQEDREDVKYAGVNRQENRAEQGQSDRQAQGQQGRQNQQGRQGRDQQGRNQAGRSDQQRGQKH